MDNSYQLWIDGSRWNIVDIAELKHNKVDGVIWKATSGDYGTDTRYAGVQLSCQQDSMPVASYLWNDPLSKPRAQVDHFLKTIDPWMDKQQFLAVDQEQWWSNWAEWNKAVRGELPWTEVDKLSASQINDTGHWICETLKQETGKKIVLYSNGFFVRDRCPEMFSWIPNYHQWWAQYPYNKEKIITTWDNLKQYYLPTTNEPTFPSGWKIPK
jgi:GH25 family lysozyme M1 (1,4-beta-N-acetylmuramidase)